MKLDRENLLAILKRIDACLSDKTKVPIHDCFCFTKDSVYTFDDISAIHYPAKLGITGGIKGGMLRDFLSSSKAKDVEITPNDRTILFKAARAKLDTPLLPESSFLFVEPDLSKATELTVNDAFLSALSRVSISMGRDDKQQWRYGVMVTPKGNGYILYATDTKTIARDVIGNTKGDRKDAILFPPRFVDLLLSLAKTDIPTKLLISDEWGEVRFQSGLRLFTKTVAGQSDKDYVETIAEIQNRTKNSVDIPEFLDRALERASMAAKYSKVPHTRIIINDGTLKLETESDAGDVRDSIDCEHENADVFVSPDLVAKGLELADKIAIVPECVKLSKGNFIYLICTHQTSGKVGAVSEGD